MPKHIVHLIFNNHNFELGVTGSILPSLCIVPQWNGSDRFNITFVMYRTTVECVDKRLILGLNLLFWYSLGQGSSVGIATCYGLDGPGIESRWGRDFLHPSRSAHGPTQLPMQWVLGFFPRGKGAGAWR